MARYFTLALKKKICLLVKNSAISQKDSCNMYYMFGYKHMYFFYFHLHIFVFAR